MTSKIDTLQELLDGLPERGDHQALLLVGAETVREWSYRRLAAEIDGLAGALLEMGLQPGDYVGLLAENRPEWIIAALAVLRAGAVIMPLDAQLGEDGLAHVVNDSGARFFFVGSGQEERFAGLDGAAELQLIPLTDLPAAASPPSSGFVRRRPDQAAALFYTSGTTGPPKGVPLSHTNLVFQINAVGDAGLVSTADRVLLPLPLHHVYPLVIGLLLPLGLGLSLVIPDVLTGPRILQAVHRGRVTALIGVPRLYQALYQGIEDRAAAGGRLARLYFRTALGLSTMLYRRLGLQAGKFLLAPLHRRLGPSLWLLASGGSALDPELAARLKALGWRVAIGYGLTETAPLLTLNPPRGGRAGSVGRAVTGVELRIEPAADNDQESASTDDDRVSPASPEQAAAKPGEREAGGSTAGATNTLGEVLARGPNVFAGYLNLPEKTAAAFSDGWYRTGDLGYLDEDGFLFLAGRASTLIVTAGGKNIQPEALEDKFAAHPLIHEAGLLSRDDKLAVLLVPELGALRRAGEQDVDSALRTALQEVSQGLPSYQRPDEYAVSREALPRTRLGKIRRHLLQQRYQQARQQRQPKDEATAVSIHEMSDHDRALLEEPAARKVWEWLVQRYPGVRLSPDTSPHLDLGVDSLGWLNLATEIGRQADVDLNEEAIGRIETVRDLLHEVVDLSSRGRAFTAVDPLADPEAVLNHSSRRWLKPLNGFQVALAWGLYQLVRLLARGLFRLRVEGREHLPEDKNFIVVPNHVSFLDAFLIGSALPFSVLRRTCFAGNSDVAFRNALFRMVCRLGRVVPIDPRRATSTSLAYGGIILDGNNNLVWFPEGERSKSGRLQDFRPGIGMLLDRRRVYVVPAHIRGAYEAWPRGRRWFKPHPVSVRFGPAVHADQLVDQAMTELPGNGRDNGKATRIAAVLQQQVAGLAEEGER